VPIQCRDLSMAQCGSNTSSMDYLKGFRESRPRNPSDVLTSGTRHLRCAIYKEGKLDTLNVAGYRREGFPRSWVRRAGKAFNAPHFPETCQVQTRRKAEAFKGREGEVFFLAGVRAGAGKITTYQGSTPVFRRAGSRNSSPLEPRH